MSARRGPTDERCLDLLVAQATEGLSQAEKLELAGLLEAEKSVDAEDFELAAAAIQLAAADLDAEMPDAVMPAEVEAALRRRAREFASRELSAGASISAPPAQEPPPSAELPLSDVKPPATVVSMPGRSGRWGWYAAAASLLLAAAGWWLALQPVLVAPQPPEVVTVINPPPPETPTEAQSEDPSGPSLEDVRNAEDAVVVAWQGTEDPAAAGVQGEVLWSDSLQAGYMVFDGLPANDPQQNQYQLWIFDAEQDERYPVDGGVFDVAAGRAVVPIDAKLRVGEPTLFAVTVEKPGGVVVSSRERLVLVAQPAAAPA
ncbi:MAG: anti-sigma factor [Acidobacteriota bacterium]|nr:anti-sigma factor [Acidobacteriota bacterium]